MRAAATLSLSGRNRLQAGQAAAGMRLWAADEGVELHVEDDRGSVDLARAAYTRFVEEGADVLLGPYGSGLVRHAAPIVCEQGRLLWNHGGTADDLPRPFLVSVAAPASTYLHQPLEVVRDAGLSEVVVAHGPGRFARAVAAGATAWARDLGLGARSSEPSAWPPEGSLESSAVFVVSTFDDEVERVAALARQRLPVGLVGCVAAGLPAFGARLGDLAEGVVGTTQWLPDDRRPEVGPSGSAFARRFEEANGEQAGYVAAQAAATGWLTTEALGRGYGWAEVHGWTTSTMLGPFSLDATWRQVGYVPVAVGWREGRLVRLR